MSEDTGFLGWIDRQPDWARDALRRHAQSPGHGISADDRAQVEARVRVAGGFPTETALDHVHLSKDHLTFGPIAGPRSLLCSLGPVTNLGRIAPDQKLSFATDGITLIYGDNGSGKSGYCRITKKVCRSLSSDRLQGDVFKEGQKPPATALIRYLPDGAEKPIDAPWTDGEPSPEAVRSISVFDTRNAHLYVGQENRIGFLPAEISLLERHAAHRREMTDTFTQEKRALEAKCRVALPVGYAPDGPVAKLFPRLTTTAKNLPTEEEITALAEFTDAHEAELEELTKSLAEDPVALAKRTERALKLVERFAEITGSLEAGLSADAAASIKAKHRANSDAVKAAEIAAAGEFAEEPLKDVGKGPWSLMYAHAQSYITSIGFEDLPTSEGDPCAFCQQPLGAEAAARLQRFRSFVSDEAAKAAASASEALKTARSEIEALNLPDAKTVEEALTDYGSMSAARLALKGRMLALLEAAGVRRASLLAASEAAEFDAAPELPASLEHDLSAEVAALTAQAEELNDSAALDTQRAASQKRVVELGDSKWLKSVLPTVLERLTDLTALKRTLECVKLVGTGQLSTHITNVRRAIVSSGLGTRIKAEIDALDLGHMPFEVNDRSSDGNSLFEVKIKAAIGQPANTDILSEGEQRALALACFLAEVGADEANHGLVFDDPVSSLDHLRIRRVASRLVAEAAKGKQVIVFTHNLLFYNEMLSLANEANIPTARREISKTSAEGFGLVTDESEPWSSRKVRDRINKVLRPKAEALAARTDTDVEAYRVAVKDFYALLRETWERLVEEILLGRVVERYSSAVQTQSLRNVIVGDDDHKTVFVNMKRVSKYSGHDQAGADQLPLPKKDEILKEIDAIDEYNKLLVKRNDATAKDRRERLEQPPAAKVA
ncbi:AAA family ATPase [Sphingobium yanoikuyae]|uniref:AAA family ATPase n=1 Tax=Sphingobium yanoikuyae TaxID=13690 RepID=UPI0008467911|nr:AAA family ATPase [Sphingobium yanoikuyae]